MRRDWAGHAIECGQVPSWKRRSDIALIVLFLPFALLLGMLVCVWIKLVSPGNVVFRQSRVGQGGRLFTIYKFRTMKPKAATSVHEVHVETLIKSDLPMMKLDLCGDTRLIKGGCMIRMTGLDELPQLANILRGEMSFVGPRPCTPCEFPLYDPQDYRRFTVLPGLTGLWQIARTRDTTFREMVAMDVDYVAHSSPWMDIRILMKTPGSVLGQFAGYVRYKVGRVTGRRRPPQLVRRTVAECSRVHGV